MTFTYHGTTFEYCDGEYNDARFNERAVEAPIALAFLATVDLTRGFELGNVTAHYGAPDHLVVDRYEHAPGVVNADVFDVHTPADWILAVSTLEHVRWDEPGEHDRDGSLDALWHLRSLLNPGGRMLVTVPLGWQPFLDSAILDTGHRSIPEPTRQCTLVRHPDQTGFPDGWYQTSDLTHERYAKTTIWAESIWVAEYYEPTLAEDGYTDAGGVHYKVRGWSADGDGVDLPDEPAASVLLRFPDRCGGGIHLDTASNRRTNEHQAAKGFHPYPMWDLHDVDPLHVEPSILLRVSARPGKPSHRHHGHIRGGVWVPAGDDGQLE